MTIFLWVFGWFIGAAFTGSLAMWGGVDFSRRPGDLVALCFLWPFVLLGTAVFTAALILFRIMLDAEKEKK